MAGISIISLQWWGTVTFQHLLLGLLSLVSSSTGPTSNLILLLMFSALLIRFALSDSFPVLAFVLQI